MDIWSYSYTNGMMTYRKIHIWKNYCKLDMNTFSNMYTMYENIAENYIESRIFITEFFYSQRIKFIFKKFFVS